jgi:hypothetical protein
LDTTKCTSKHLQAALAATVALCTSDLINAKKLAIGVLWQERCLMVILSSLVSVLGSDKSASTQNFTNFSNVVESRGIGLSGGTAVEVSKILVSGSGSCHIQKGITVETETVHWKRLGQALPECDNRHQ